jgi:hypothetical protein
MLSLSGDVCYWTYKFPIYQYLEKIDQVIYTEILHAATSEFYTLSSECLNMS